MYVNLLMHANFITRVKLTHKYDSASYNLEAHWPNC